jgi:hypothetical protein
VIYERSEEYVHSLNNIQEAILNLENSEKNESLERNLGKCQEKKREILGKKRRFDEKNKRRYKKMLKMDTTQQKKEKKVLFSSETSKISQKNKKLNVCRRIQGYFQGKLADLLQILERAREYQRKTKQK